MGALGAWTRPKEEVSKTSRRAISNRRMLRRRTFILNPDSIFSEPEGGDLRCVSASFLTPPPSRMGSAPQHFSWLPENVIYCGTMFHHLYSQLRENFMIKILMLALTLGLSASASHADTAGDINARIDQFNA